MPVKKVAVTLPEELFEMVERPREIEHRSDRRSCRRPSGPTSANPSIHPPRPNVGCSTRRSWISTTTRMHHRRGATCASGSSRRGDGPPPTGCGCGHRRCVRALPRGSTRTRFALRGSPRSPVRPARRLPSQRAARQGIRAPPTRPPPDVPYGVFYVFTAPDRIDVLRVIHTARSDAGWPPGGPG